MENTINPLPELAPLLKQLRLSGILDSLASRNREAIEGKLAYTEFLALVVQDEVARRDQNKFTARVRRAGFRGEKTLELSLIHISEPTRLVHSARMPSSD